jgi:hypothetical protein
MISYSPSSVRQVSQINLSPSLSATHSQLKFPPPYDIPFGRNRWPAKKEAALEVSLASGAALSRKFLLFPTCGSLRNDRPIGVSGIENRLSIAPFAGTENREPDKIPAIARATTGSNER